MKHGVAIAVAVLAGLAVWMLGLAGGYYVDPALFPLGMLYPFVGLALAACSLLVGAVYALGCLTLFFMGKGRRYLGVALVALIGPAIVLAGPRLFGAYDAFVYRMKGFSETDYQRLAADIMAELDRRGVRTLPAGHDPLTLKPVPIPQTLIDSHDLLAISRFPLRVLAKDGGVSVMWGSGLTGGYTVAVSLNPEPLPGWADDLRQGDYDLPVTYIYSGVAASLLP
ncbi:hypothetical protein [Pelagibius sp. 7325]|uniref:hypothetical protein n=1 Tax=Pelagibius sp. 7325 TaxID=3131994 RepID=UPI0030EB9A5B